ncbi:hypothetical protein [Sanguibacter sp. Z1732]|uniref:hypothetical protein n=1 Tax=Sanguibacter sp. Z1732 TaxID=3435412 RepID=UPI003D9CA56F
MDQRPAGPVDRARGRGPGPGPHRFPGRFRPHGTEWVRPSLGARRLGHTRRAGHAGRTWDRILVSADGGQIPTELVSQLDDGGRMVIPAAGRMAVVTRAGQEVRTEHLPGQWAFVRLR